MFKKALSILTVTVMISTFITAIPTFAEEKEYLINDTFDVSDNWVEGSTPNASNGYIGTDSKKTQIENNRLKITGSSSFSRNLTAPVTSGRVGIEMDFEFGTLGNVNYAFPALIPTDGVSDGSRAFAQPQLVREKLTNIPGADNFYVDARVKYKLIINADYTKRYDGEYRYDMYLINTSTNVPVGRIIGAKANDKFNGDPTTYSVTKDLAKLFFYLGGDNQVLYIDSLKAYKIPMPEKMIYSEDFKYYKPNATPNVDDNQYNAWKFQNFGKNPVVNNGGLEIIKNNTIKGYVWGMLVMPNDIKNKNFGVSAVDGLTVDFEFTAGNIIPYCSDFPIITNESYYADWSPLRSRILPNADGTSAELQVFQSTAGLGWVTVGTVYPNKTYRFTSTMQFVSSQTQKVTLYDISANTKNTKNFDLSYPTHQDKKTFIESPFTRIRYGIEPNSIEGSSVVINNVSFYENTQPQPNIDKNLVLFDDYNKLENTILTSADGYNGITNDADRSCKINDGKLKISTKSGKVSSFTKKLPTAVEDGRVAVEFEMTFDKAGDMNQFLPGLCSSDGMENFFARHRWFGKNLITWNANSDKTTSTDSVDSGYTIKADNTYKQTIIADYTQTKDGEYLYDYYIQDMTDPTKPLFVKKGLQAASNFYNTPNKNLSNIQFYFGGEQNVYIDNLKVYKADSQIELSDTIVSDNSIGNGILSKDNNSLNAELTTVNYIPNSGDKPVYVYFVLKNASGEIVDVRCGNENVPYLGSKTIKASFANEGINNAVSCEMYVWNDVVTKPYSLKKIIQLP